MLFYNILQKDIRKMKRTNLIKLAMSFAVIPILMTSCLTPTRFTYASENIKGNAVMDEEKMLADYGEFAIQYTSEGGVSIINKSDSMMYIDMAESYYVNNGTAQQLYTNSVTTNYSSGSQGATVNLGSVANALGVGGVVGTLAQGVNVGGSNTSGSSTQVFEERYISIPPLSRKSVKSVLFEPVNSGNWREEKEHPWQDTQTKGGYVKKGTYNYDKYSSPTQEYIFAYTFNPNEKFQSTRDLFYVRTIEINKSLRNEVEAPNQTTREMATRKDFFGNFVYGFGIAMMILVGILGAAGAL